MQSKKIGIITISLKWLLLNYGTFFQHYALRKVLKELGFNAYRIEYDSSGEDFNPESCNIRAFCAAFWHWLRWGKSLGDELSRFFFYRNRIGRTRNEYERLIANIHEEQESSPAFVIVGGDQVLTSRDQRLFGSEFVCDKMSYSVSADWTTVVNDRDWRQTAAEAFSHFCGAGIREKRGVDIINELCPSVNAIVTADPVLLLESRDYYNLVGDKQVLKKPTLVAHVVNWRCGDDAYVDKLESLSAMLGVELRIVASQGCERYVPFRYALHIGPTDYLSVIRDAKYVITNSFHGLVFCLLFNKQFCFVRQHNLPGANQNERQESILRNFDLVDRIFDSSEDVESLAAAIQRQVDFGLVNSKISQCRMQGISFLKSKLNGPRRI